jgi:probable F420-dependent oxidoreductase
MVARPYDPALVTREGMESFCRTAEAVGFDGVGFTDHPAPTAKWLQHGGHDSLDPFVAMSFCAAVTSRLRLVPNIVVLPYRHPLIVAKMVATLDALSGGRFTLAVATGYLKGEYRALGVDFEQRNALFDQAIQVMRGVWTADDFSFEGDGISARELAANPKPQQLPPIWIGGNSRQSRRRVATYGDGWTPFAAPRVVSQTARTAPLETTADLATMLDELWHFVDEAGRDRSEIDVAASTSTTTGAPGSKAFSADRHQAQIDELARLGVTWTHVGVPGESLAGALETLEEYGETVIAASRA